MRSEKTNPYVGLRPFDTHESLLFFGRNDQILELLQRLHQHHFVAVIGSSGSGKSSLLRAGVIPALKAGYLVDDSDHWLISIMKPGHSPLYNLAKAILQQLAPKSKNAEITLLAEKIKEEGADALLRLFELSQKEIYTNFFLLIDQFEELFRFALEQDEVAKKDEAIDFVNIILELSGQTQIPIFVVLTMRSDFIGDCVQFRGLPEAMNQSLFLVPKLSRMQLKMAIEGPAKLYGGKLNSTLTSHLLNAIGKVNDELPLLQHALMRIWDHEINVDKSGELDLADFKYIGGIEMALSNHADEALREMDKASFAITKTLFQALTTIDEHGRKIRRPVSLAQLVKLTAASEKQLMQIIDRFITGKRSFLVVNEDPDTNDKIIDISHESLIRQWQRLDRWVDEEGEAASIYERLTRASALNRQDKKDLLTGSELQNFLDWYHKFKPTEIWANRYRSGFKESIAYLQNSEKEQLRLLEMEGTRKRKVKFLIRAIAGLMLLLVILGATASLYLKENNEKLVQTDEAYKLHIKAQEMVKKDPTEALRLETAALEKYNEAYFKESVNTIYSSHSFYETIVKHDTAAALYLYLSPDSKTAGILGPDFKNATIWDFEKQDSLTGVIKHKSDIISVEFSPDGKSVITSSDSIIRLSDIKGNTIHELKLEDPLMEPLVTFSPKGETVLIAGRTETRLWQLSSNELIPYKPDLGWIYTVDFSPDGKMFVTDLNYNQAQLWGIDGKRLATLIGHKSYVQSVAFSPDGKKILTGSDDKTARLWELKPMGEEGWQVDSLATIKGHTGAITSVTFSRDSLTFATGSEDGTARLWFINGKLKRIQEFKGHQSRVNTVAFTKDGKRLITSSDDGTVRSWDLKGTPGKWSEHDILLQGVPLIYRSNPNRPDLFKVFSLKGESLTTFDLGKIRAYEDATKFDSFTAYWDGKHMLYGNPDGTAHLVNMKAEILDTLEFTKNRINNVGTASKEEPIEKKTDAKDNKISALATSPDGNEILVGWHDGTTGLWDIRRDSIVREFEIKADDKEEISNLSNNVTALGFSSDSRKVVVGYGNGTVALWDFEGQLLQRFEGHEAAINSVGISPDGKTVLTAAQDNTARLWDMEGNLIHIYDPGIQMIAALFSPEGDFILTYLKDIEMYGIMYWKTVAPLQDFLDMEKLNPLSTDEQKAYVNK